MSRLKGPNIPTTHRKLCPVCGVAFHAGGPVGSASYEKSVTCSRGCGKVHGLQKTSIQDRIRAIAADKAEAARESRELVAFDAGVPVYRMPRGVGYGPDA